MDKLQIKPEVGDKAGKAASQKKPAKRSGFRIIPSGVWIDGTRAIWSGLTYRERALIVMGVVVPALDQIARLGSLGVMMRSISKGIREPLDHDARLVLGLIILGATGLTVVIESFSGNVKQRLKEQFTRMVRKIYAGMVADAGQSPFQNWGADFDKLDDHSRNFQKSAVSGVTASLAFVSEVFLVVFLVMVLTWFHWIVGAILLVSGLAAIMALKHRVRPQRKKEDERISIANKALSNLLEEIAGSGTKRKGLIEEYASNEFDRLTFAESQAKSRLPKRIATSMNVAAAILMAAVFFLVSAEGAFDESKIVWMIVFVFGLRMTVSHGKTAMVKWGVVLGEKRTLMALAEGAIATRAHRASRVESAGFEIPRPGKGKLPEPARQFDALRAKSSVAQAPCDPRGYLLLGELLLQSESGSVDERDLASFSFHQASILARLLEDGEALQRASALLGRSEDLCPGREEYSYFYQAITGRSVRAMLEYYGNPGSPPSLLLVGDNVNSFREAQGALIVQSSEQLFGHSAQSFLDSRLRFDQVLVLGPKPFPEDSTFGEWIGPIFEAGVCGVGVWVNPLEEWDFSFQLALNRAYTGQRAFPTRDKVRSEMEKFLRPADFTSLADSQCYEIRRTPIFGCPADHVSNAIFRSGLRGTKVDQAVSELFATHEVRGPAALYASMHPMVELYYFERRLAAS